MLTDDTRHIISVKARSTCDLFALSYKTLSDILNEFPDIRPMLEQAALNQLMKITQTVSDFALFAVEMPPSNLEISH